MRTEKAVITIFGHDDEITQDISVQYTIEVREGFWDKVWFAITECKVLDEIVIEPSDLKADLEMGIQFNEGFQKTVFKMECEIECKITAEQHEIH